MRKLESAGRAGLGPDRADCCGVKGHRLGRQSMSQIASLPQRQPDSLALSQAQARTAELSVVVPTFKESGNVAVLVQRLDAALEGHDWEAIFVDDDSPDGTWENVKAIAATDARVRCLRRVSRRGLAGACIEGMLSSRDRKSVV